MFGTIVCSAIASEQYRMLLQDTVSSDALQRKRVAGQVMYV
jgi:hypothetical protein